MEQPVQIKEADAIQMLHQYNEDMLPKKFGKIGKAWTGLLIIVLLAGIYFYTVQLRKGLIITGMRDFVFWGIYISNFVFFVAISLVGSLITAVLYLLKVSWRAPLTRLAEIIAVAAIIFAGLIIVVDMGRPERVVNMFRYGRIQSPIIWDVMVVTTYMTLSILLLYFPLLPSIAFCRDHMKGIPKWQHRMYKILSLGWKSSPEQYKLVKKAVTILSVMIIPVALCIHTVTSWLFASTYRPGWDSTNFGAYFVSGAFLVGCGGVVAGMYLLRRFNFGYDKFLTDKHFDKMGRLLVLLAMIYAYFSINEYLIPAYKMKGEEAHHLNELFTGYYAPMFWSVQFFGMVLPIIVLLFKKGRRPLPMFIMAVLVIVCAWFKRYLIVIPTMSFLPVQEIPEAWKHYSPTFQEWAITAGSLAGALLIITFFVRYFPIISVWEVAEEKGISHDIITKHLHEGNNVPIAEKKSMAGKIISILIIGSLLFNNASFAQEKKDSSKINFSMTVSSILSNDTRSVKAHLIKKVDGKKTPVDDLKTPLNLYLNEVKDHDPGNGTGWIGKAYVNDEGDAIFQFPNWFNNLTDTFHQFTFIVKMNGDANYEDAEGEVTVTKARIDLEYSGEDSVKTASATLYGWKDTGYVPAPKVGIKLCIKRTFNFLPFVEADATTDDSGKISGDLPLDLPGNSNKTITIAARVEDDETYGTVEITKDVPWAVLPKVNPVRGRTLWSGADNAPLLLVISSLAIITIIWGTIFYLISMLVKIRKLGKT